MTKAELFKHGLIKSKTEPSNITTKVEHLANSLDLQCQIILKHLIDIKLYEVSFTDGSVIKFIYADDSIWI